MIEVGRKLPAFALSDEAGNTVTNRTLAGKRTVLFIFPKADTPG